MRHGLPRLTGEVDRRIITNFSRTLTEEVKHPTNDDAFDAADRLR